MRASGYYQTRHYHLVLLHNKSKVELHNLHLHQPGVSILTELLFSIQISEYSIVPDCSPNPPFFAHGGGGKGYAQRSEHTLAILFKKIAILYSGPRNYLCY